MLCFRERQIPQATRNLFEWSKCSVFASSAQYSFAVQELKKRECPWRPKCHRLRHLLGISCLSPVRPGPWDRDFHFLAWLKKHFKRKYLWHNDKIKSELLRYVQALSSSSFSAGIEQVVYRWADVLFGFSTTRRNTVWPLFLVFQDFYVGIKHNTPSKDMYWTVYVSIVVFQKLIIAQNLQKEPTFFGDIFNYRYSTRTECDPTLSQLNPINILPFYFLKIYRNGTLAFHQSIDLFRQPRSRKTRTAKLCCTKEVIGNPIL
jgi:hypothetical protein